MTKVIVRALIEDFLRVSINNNRSATVIAYMVGPAMLIQDEIPVDPGDSPAI